MLLLMVFVLFTPNFTSLYTFFLKDQLKFTDIDFANISAFGALFFAVALAIYYTKLRQVQPKKLFVTFNIINWIFSLSFIFVATGVLEKINHVKVFCVFTVGVTETIKFLYLMPILAIWCQICPKNLEAVSVTLITGIFNFALLLGENFGALLIWLFQFERQDYSNIWVPVLIDNAYLLIILMVLCIAPFPDPLSKFFKLLRRRG